MLRKTHISLGIATALAVIHPATVSGCLFVVMGDAIGGWIPDVDLNSRKILFSFICTPAGEHFQCFVPDTKCPMKKKWNKPLIAAIMKGKESNYTNLKCRVGG